MSVEEQVPLLGEEDGSTPPPSLSSRFRTALHSPSSLNGLEKFLALISIFLLLLTATGFGLFAGEAGKLGREERKHEGHKEGRVRTSTVERSVTMTRTSTVVTGGPTGTPGKNDAVCLTSTCVQVAARVINALDTSIDPCEDFYSFANGGWLEDNPVPEDLALFGVAQDLGNRNKRTILSILSETPSSTLDSSDQTNLKHLRSFYASCLDEDLLDKEGSRPILDVVKAVLSAWRDKNSKSSLEEGSFNVQEEQEGGDLEDLTRKASKRDRLTSTLSYLHARGIPSLFEVYTDGDVAVDPKNMVLWLSQSGLGLPAKEYYHNKDVTSTYSEVIRHTLSNIYEELGERTDRIKEVSKEMLKFESELAKQSLDNEDLEDPVKSYNRRSAKAVQRLFPSISLANYIGAFNPRPAFPDPIIVTSPKYLEDLALLIEDTEEEVLEAYFVFRVAQQLGSLLGPKQTIRKEIQKLKNKLTGIADGTKEDRSDVCLTSLLENYGFLIGRYYILKAFTGDSKKYAEDVIEATIQAFKDRLPALDWLDEKSRKAAEEKASAITHKIGYPSTPDTLDPKSLERYYTPYLPISSSDFFGNVLRSRVADQMRLWTTVGKQRDLGVWEMVPSEVNAYYNPPANEIVFPAGILQSPYFSKDWPEYMVFGGFGCVAGHEISHAFDQSGRRYNKDGKLEDWWSNSTVANFEHLQSCIIDQYANYTVTDAKGTKYHIKSKFTNGEDMADAGGLGQSYQAWSKRFEEDPMGSKFQNYLLPGLNYTREQLFYITFAQGWALNARKDEAIRRILIDPHSPPNYRVLGPLSNDVNFSNAFGCKAGQPMSNVDKCKVW